MSDDFRGWFVNCHIYSVGYFYRTMLRFSWFVSTFGHRER